jgi:hypothetical protein
MTAGNGPVRPRANTISHVDASAIHLIAAASSNPRNIVQGGHSRHGSLMGLPQHDNYAFGNGMSAALGQRGMNHGLPKLDTNGLGNLHMNNGLHTAPVDPQIMEFDWDMFSREGNTVNPNALHYSDSPQSMAVDSSVSYQHVFPDMTPGQTNENFDWMNGFDHNMDFTANENAIDGSSPSAISTASQSGISEVMLDGSNQPVSSGSMWQNNMMAPSIISPNPFAFDMTMSGFPDFLNGGGAVSPHTFPAKQASDPYFSTPPPSMTSLSPSLVSGLTNSTGIQQTMNFGPETPSSLSGPQQHSPIATITEATRQALVIALNQMTPFGGRKNSFAAFSSPLAPQINGRQPNDNTRNLPSTPDLQRFVGAYLQYFQPHLPFLHIPTLSFEVPASQVNSARQTGMVGGRGCLLLSMAAIGALYEMEQAVSRELFELAKKMIQLYLEERRKADVRKADMRKVGMADKKAQDNPVQTPVWLVQAMLLNVIYGHNCGDKTAGDIAATHCAALISLSRAAGLLRPPNGTSAEDLNPQDDAPMADTFLNSNRHDLPEDQRAWLFWRITEERKRTLFTVFALSSLLVSAFNHTPALTNSDILLELPCDEEFWACENAAAFHAKGGVAAANNNVMLFHDALNDLLRTSDKQQQNGYVHGMPTTNLKPSTFGCFVLINALHNYIYETRQRHQNRTWTNEETEKMHRHIEPALKAWQEAWASNPNHSLERANPYGFGALSADSIPLLDLAYVRLFVNLARSKEKFWQRDYDGMADEITKGTEILQHAEHSPMSNMGTNSDPSEVSSAHSGFGDSPATSKSSPDFKLMNMTGLANSISAVDGSQQLNGAISKRERHLRKAAFYAADSLSMSDKLGVTFADFTSRELPLQSALCLFDCAQVLAEWVITVQERVGPYLGVLGRDDVNYSQVPAIMVLEEEDIKLLIKIQEVLQSAEVKMNYEATMTGTLPGLVMQQQQSLSQELGYAAKILRVTAFMLDKAAVWPSKCTQSFINFTTVLTYRSDASHGTQFGNASSTYAQTSREFTPATDVKCNTPTDYVPCILCWKDRKENDTDTPFSTTVTTILLRSEHQDCYDSKRYHMLFVMPSRRWASVLFLGHL